MSKKTVVTDLHIEMDPPPNITRFIFPRKGETRMDAMERELKQWAREFEEFVRDHRSQDAIDLRVVRETDDICSHCGFSWETDETGLPLCCNEAQEEHQYGAKGETA